jgi:hypothetical protein
MPLIINGNFENGALFYYFWLRRFFPVYKDRIGKRNGNGEKQKWKAMSGLLKEIASSPASAALLATTFYYKLFAGYDTRQDYKDGHAVPRSGRCELRTGDSAFFMEDAAVERLAAV